MADSALARIVSAGGPGAKLKAPAPDRSYRNAREFEATLDDVGGEGQPGMFRLQRPYIRIGADSEFRPRADDALHGLVLIVGPESGEIEVRDTTGTERLMVWDEACFYERLMTVLLKRPTRAGDEVTIRVTDGVPDYARCRRPVEPPEEISLKVVGYMTLPE
jgi:hypothetical protein